MRKITLKFAAAASLCCILGTSILASCKKDDEVKDDCQRVTYSELDLPDVGSNSSKYGITDEDIQGHAKELGVEAAALEAVRKVDTGGRGGFIPDGNSGSLPLLLFQGHIFWQQLRSRGINPQDHVKGNEDILYQRLDKTKYVGGLGEYEHLERAIKIDEEAALSSASWGMFQIMGYNYGSCGCESVKEFVNGMKESESAQYGLFINYLKSHPSMVNALKNRDWKTFAKLYFGPTYAQNRYDDKLAKAYSSLK